MLCSRGRYSYRPLLHTVLPDAVCCDYFPPPCSLQHFTQPGFVAARFFFFSFFPPRNFFSAIFLLIVFTFTQPLSFDSVLDFTSPGLPFPPPPGGRKIHYFFFFFFFPQPIGLSYTLYPLRSLIENHTV